jgi:hypothetical protein
MAMSHPKHRLFDQQFRFCKQTRKVCLFQHWIGIHNDSGGITAGQFGAMPHLKFKIFTQFSVALRIGF